MNIERVFNEEWGEYYDYFFSYGDSELGIAFGKYALELTLKFGEERDLDFLITSEDEYIFGLFNSLYNHLIKVSKCCDSNIITVNDGKICLISDSKEYDSNEKLIISKNDESQYMFSFRTDKDIEELDRIVVNMSFDSKIVPFDVFILLYLGLQKIEPLYHQFSLAEMKYLSRERHN